MSNEKPIIISAKENKGRIDVYITGDGSYEDLLDVYGTITDSVMDSLDVGVLNEEQLRKAIVICIRNVFTERDKRGGNHNDQK